MGLQEIKAAIYRRGLEKIAKDQASADFAKGRSFKPHEAAKFVKAKKKLYSMADAYRLGEALGINWAKVNFKVADFLAGLAVENEHFDDPQTKLGPHSELMIAKIAWRHLKENPAYYTRLRD